MASLGEIYYFSGESLCLAHLNFSYPGQEHVTGNTKIPSILFYDRKGKVRAAGAEAEDAQVLAQAEDDEWSKVELYDPFDNRNSLILTIASDSNFACDRRR